MFKVRNQLIDKIALLCYNGITIKGGLIMKKLLSCLSIILALIILMCSCSPVYVDIGTQNTTETIDADLGEEYFTKGGVNRHRTAHSDDGYVHEGVWYYIERQDYHIKTVTEEGGKKITSTAKKMIERIVKYNPVTDTVSSPCLDPVCNHSVGSGCLMIGPETGYIQIFDVVDNWMILTKSESQDFKTQTDYGSSYKQYRNMLAYNVKTGAWHEIYSEGLEDNISTEYTGNSIWEDKMYIVKHVLDYSKTGFRRGDSRPMSDYKPETKSYLYEYDIAKNTQKELFEIPAGATVNRITNKRFILTVDGEYFTCDLDGSNMQKSEVLDFLPYNRNGNYAYQYIDSKHIKVYDLKTDTAKTVTLTDLDTRGNPIFTDDGILISTSFKGKAQIWQSDLEGENFEVIFEWDKADARYVGATEKYLFVAMVDSKSGGSATSGYLGANRRCIDLETGEYKPIPLLELILPENAWLESEGNYRQ